MNRCSCGGGPGKVSEHDDEVTRLSERAPNGSKRLEYCLCRLTAPPDIRGACFGGR